MVTPASAARPAGFTVSVAVLTTPLYVAVMVTAGGTVTAALGLTGKFFVVAPAATVTETGTVAAALLLVSVTTAPPTGAALPSVTVPVLPALPVTAVRLTLTPTRAAAGFTVSVAVLTTPLYVAVMVTAVGTVTAALVVTGKFFVVAPAATVTETGTVARSEERRVGQE